MVTIIIVSPLLPLQVWDDAAEALWADLFGLMTSRSGFFFIASIIDLERNLEMERWTQNRALRRPLRADGLAPRFFFCERVYYRSGGHPEMKRWTKQKPKNKSKSDGPTFWAVASRSGD